MLVAKTVKHAKFGGGGRPIYEFETGHAGSEVWKAFGPEHQHLVRDLQGTGNTRGQLLLGGKPYTIDLVGYTATNDETKVCKRVRLRPP
jgi:hypothetical protein